MAISNGGIIGPDNIPTGKLGTAGGVWKLNDATDYIEQGLWPVVQGLSVPNSCRFDGTSAYLTRTPSSAGNRQKWTWSGWVKRSSNFTAQQTFFGVSASSSTYHLLYFSGNDTITHNYEGTYLETTQKFRDPSAWYHIVYAVDTTQGTASNRIKVYVNGVQVTSFSYSGYPSQNTEMNINNTVRHDVANSGASYNHYINGYMAEVCFINNQQLDPTSFGEFDTLTPTVWKPKSVSGLTFGTNGFYLPFQNSGALGQDDSGNGNNFTVNNLTSTDQTTDTPTNNFATFNPLATTKTQGVLSEGNLEFDNPGGSDGWEAVASTISATAGKWYFEYKIIDGGASAGNGSQVGFLNYDVSNFQNDANSDLAATGEYGWYGAGNTYINGSDAGVISSYTDGDIVMVAMDLDNSNVYWGKNGSWVNSGDPTSGAAGTGGHTIVSASSNAFSFAVTHREGGNGQANFGNPPFAISSGNTDANSFGDFEYAVPSGYFALNNKNLTLYG